MTYKTVKSKLEGLLEKYKIAVYDKFENSEIPKAKIAGFLGAPRIEIADTICYTDASQRIDKVKTLYDLELMGEGLDQVLTELVARTISDENAFFDVKVSELSLSPVTRLPKVNISFTYLQHVGYAYKNRLGERIFCVCGVNGFVENLEIKADIFSPKIKLTTGSAYFGTSVLVGKKLSLTGIICQSGVSKFKTDVFSYVNSQCELTISGENYTLRKADVIEILSQDGFSAKIRLEGYLK